MLQLMRNSTRNIVIKVVLFGIVILGMASYAFIDMFTARVQGEKVASVGDIEVALTDYARAYETELRRLQQLGISREMAETLGLGRRVIQRLITDAAFDAETHDQSISVTDNAVVDAIRTNPNFADNFGNFSRAQFQFALSNSGLTEAIYVESLKKNMARSYYLSSLIEAVALPQTLSETLTLYHQETRESDYLILPLSLAPKEKPTSEQVLEDFYQANLSNFAVPELKNFSYILIDPTHLAKAITPSEEDIQAAYDMRQAAFVMAEKRDLDQLIFSDQQSAISAYDQIMAGATFEEIAKAQANVSETRLGLLSKSDFPSDALADYVFSQPDIGTLAPIEGDFGWVVFRLNAIEAATVQPLEEVRETLVEEAALEKAIDQSYRLSTQLTDLINGGSTLDEAANALDLPLISDITVDRRGLDGNAKFLAELPQDRLFLQTIFDTNDGEMTLVEAIDGNRFFIAKLTATLPPRTKEFAEVKNQVEQLWVQDQQFLSLNERAEAVIARIDTGANLEKIAEELSLDIKKTGVLKRDGANKPQEFPDTLLSEIFATKSGKATFVEFEQGVAIAVVKDIQRKPTPENLKVGADNLKQSSQNSLIETLNQALQTRHGVNLNTPLIQSLNTNNDG